MEHPDIHPQPGALVNGACLSDLVVLTARRYPCRDGGPLQPASSAPLKVRRSQRSDEGRD